MSSNLRTLFLKILAINDEIEVMDSDNLQPGWENMIDNNNVDSQYRWENDNALLREHESHLHTENYDSNCTESTSENTDEIQSYTNSESVRENMKPKRVLAYSSPKLLKLFSKNLKSSVDGTFKSACTHYKQNFTWMLKMNGYWIPVVHGWLPDKTQTSYKVNYNL